MAGHFSGELIKKILVNYSIFKVVETFDLLECKDMASGSMLNSSKVVIIQISILCLKHVSVKGNQQIFTSWLLA